MAHLASGKALQAHTWRPASAPCPARPAACSLRLAKCQAQSKSSSTSSSSSNSDSQPLSPASVVAGASGVTVNGYSPTSMQGWKIIKDTLRQANVKMLSAQEVIFARERGVPVIDVRPADAYEKGHISGATNVPYYQPISGWEPMKVARRVGFALFGVLNGTEVNPNFTQEAAARIDPEKGAILYCSLGGTLDPTENSKKGLQSRSLIAAWQLVDAGHTNISVMKGGFSEWVNAGREVDMMVDA